MNANTIDASGGRPVLRIVHPTDFSAASDVAFDHALKLALVTGAELDLLHVSRQRNRIGWEAFPGVRATLERWGIPQPDGVGAPRGRPVGSSEIDWFRAEQELQARLETAEPAGNRRAIEASPRLRRHRNAHV